MVHLYAAAALVGLLATGAVVGGCRSSPPAREGYADCDGNPDNGAETDIRSSTDNCGACGRVCQAGHGKTDCVDGACVPTCDPGFAACGLTEQGCDAELGTADHCRGCWDRCVDASCTAEGCSPATVVASGILGNEVSHLSDTNAYFDSMYDYRVVPLDGGPVEQISKESGRYFPPYAQCDDVVFGVLHSRRPENPLHTFRLVKASKSGHLTELGLVHGTVMRQSLTCDSEYLYFAPEWGSGIGAVPIAGGTVETVTKKLKVLRDMVSDAGALYWLAPSPKVPNEGVVVKLLKGTTEPVHLADVVAPRYLALDADHVYFTDHGNYVLRVPKSGGRSVPVARAGINGFRGLAIQGQSIYWAVRSSTGMSLHRVAKP